MAKERRHVLVVDDDPGVVAWLVEELTESGFVTEGVHAPQAALARLEERPFHVVVSDVEMPGMRGIDLVQAMHAKRPEQLIILITAFGTIDLAMQCVRAGATDFLAKPFQMAALVHAIERALRERRMRREVVRLRSSLVTEVSDVELVAVSTPMKRVMDIARRIAASPSTVLLTGESGVGKTAIARFIHNQSARHAKRFVQLNCAALPAGLVEAELFGVKRGAFTDAREDREGMLVQADGGTLFLDEVGEMAIDVQPKLLVALDSGVVRPVGGRDEQRFDARLIAATNRPLEDALRERRLRQDLYHRLNVIPIEIPPLRQRTDDIPRLVDVWLQRLGRRAGRPVAGVSEEALRWICAQPWPGNVRELANVLERAVMLTDHDVLVLEDFVRSKRDEDDDDAFFGGAATQILPLEEVERRYIRMILDRCDGNKAKAARALGIDRTTLWRRMGGQEPS